MQKNSKVRGFWGEQLATALLKQKGHKILENNYKRLTGEVDIISRDGHCVVFTEVKTWLGTPIDDLGRAISAVKISRIQKTAILFMQDYPDADDCTMRFDVIVMDRHSGLLHFCDAF
ncbi:MAG: YraN family protein [Spirochaetaceae bacterium]|nr:MAG: YraN family protein [Spirochaetaceae bacterium]